MTNTYIEPGKCSFEEMMPILKTASMPKMVRRTNQHGNVHFFLPGKHTGYATAKSRKWSGPSCLSGNVFNTLMNIDAIGDDLDMNQGGGCGKGGQSPLPVSNGSPHIRIRKCLVGGK